MVLHSVWQFPGYPYSLICTKRNRLPECQIEKLQRESGIPPQTIICDTFALRVTHLQLRCNISGSNLSAFCTHCGCQHDHKTHLQLRSTLGNVQPMDPVSFVPVGVTDVFRQLNNLQLTQLSTERKSCIRGSSNLTAKEPELLLMQVEN